jgi:pimeloyl-ACP methyl ester carboxylesterase
VVAAHAFAGDAEMDELFGAFINERILRTCVHNPERLQERDFAIPGMGWWASTMTTWDGVNRPGNIRARVATWPNPVLILRGDSDYLPEHAAAEFVSAFPNSRLVRIPAAGHFIWMDQPERYCAEIESFLMEPH